MKTFKRLAALLFVLAAPSFLGSAPAVEQVEYGTYINQKFEFEMKYPKALLSYGPAPTNYEGRTFKSEDEMVKMHVWGEANDANRDLKQEYDWALGNMADDQVTNKVFGKGVFVISGYRLDNIFYRKEMSVTEGGHPIFLILEIEYHKSNAKTWNPIALACAKSLKLTKCEGYPADDIFK